MKKSNFGNIVLIGFSGAGKSTIGDWTARELGCNFLDLDRVIEAQEEKPLDQLVKELGHEKFCDLEASHARRLCFVKDTVIATGGSVIYRDDAMRHLKWLGTIVFIDAKLDTIKQAIAEAPNRGIVFPDPTDSTSIDDLYRERLPLYRQWADVIISRDGLSAQECAKQIVELMNQKGNDERVRA
jgi:shikimate kinase